MLRFCTSVHFGDSGAGGGLGDVISFCRADTFFSALCNEAVKIEKGLLKKLFAKANDGKILFSDLMPWHCGIDGRYDLYIPRPFLTVSSERENKSKDSDDIEDAIERKKLKKRAYIRASQWDGYLKYMETGELQDEFGEKRIEPEPEFGKFVLNTHFNSRTAKPYQCGSYYFRNNNNTRLYQDGAEEFAVENKPTKRDDNTGLYLVVVAEEEADLKWLETLIRLVGFSGIGGRRSSGSGKFEFEAAPFILSENEFYGPDDAALFNMLIDVKAPEQMTLASVIPSEKDIPAVYEGTGKLIKRSGFAFPCAKGEPVKMNSIYMMASGSCFHQRVVGKIADVDNADIDNGMSRHSVYRYGKGLYVGFSLCNSGK